MNNSLPPHVAALPLTNPALGAYVVESLLTSALRKSDTLLIVMCDDHARPIAPLILQDVPWDAPAFQRETIFRIVDEMGVNAVVAIASGREIPDDFLDSWRLSAHDLLGDRLIHFYTVTPTSVQHRGQPVGV